MPVVTQQGLVGRVDAVTATASRVQLISDPGSVINVRLQRQNVEAQVMGSLTGEIFLDMVAQNVDLADGEILLTSGLGGTFPSDILVGQVVEVKKSETQLFQTASVQPVVEFTTLRAVLVIKNFSAINISPLIPSLEQ